MTLVTALGTARIGVVGDHYSGERALALGHRLKKPVLQPPRGAVREAQGSLRDKADWSFSSGLTK